MTTLCRSFPGVPASAAASRQFVSGVLAFAGCPATELVVFCVSELVANSVTHSLSAGPAGVVRVRLVTAAPQWVRLEVRDACRWPAGSRGCRGPGRLPVPNQGAACGWWPGWLTRAGSTAAG